MAKITLSKRNKSIAIGLVFGLLSALCVGAYIASVDAKASAAQAEMLNKYGGDQIDVCVAKRDIAAGEVVTDGDIEMRTWIATLLPANAMIHKADVVGKQVGSTILAGEVISEARFGFDSAAIDVPEGKVAVSVPAREVQAVGGAIDAGMTTDVYAVGASATTKIAGAAQVLATSLSTDTKTSTTNAWVTLAVEPEIVQELVAAAENLEIYFALPSAQATEGAASEVESGVEAPHSPGDPAEDATETSSSATNASNEDGTPTRREA